MKKAAPKYTAAFLLLILVSFFKDDHDPSIQYVISPLALMAIASAASIGSRAYTSFKQNKLAKELATAERPSYEPPDALYKSLNAANYLASSGLPGKSEYEAMIKENTAEMYERATNLSQTPSQALGIAQQVAGKENQLLRDMTLKEAEFKANAARNVMDQQNLIAGYEDKAFDVNKFQPYMQSMAAASALKGASMQNLQGGISDISSMAGLYAAFGGGSANITGGNSGVGSTSPGTFDYNSYLKYKLATAGLGEEVDPTIYGYGV